MTNCTDKEGMMHADHQFFTIKLIEDYVTGSPSYRVAKNGVLVVCATCGEVREAWETGEIVIRPRGPAPKPHDQNSTAAN